MKIRNSLLLLILLSFFFKTNAQEIEITTTDKPPYNLFQDILFEINLINTTDKPIKYFNSLYTSWDSYEEVWNITIDGHPSDLYSFSDAHEGKFSENSIITLQPGDKKHIRSRLISLKSPGHYTFSYTQTQSPSLVKKQFAKNISAYSVSQEINSFTVSTAIEFDVADIQSEKIENVVEISWPEWLIYSEKELYDNNNHFSNLEKALNEPENVYSLNIGCDGINEAMLKRIGDLKNLKYLALSNVNIETFPIEIAKLNLYELKIYPKKGNIISFSNGLSVNNTLRRLSAEFNNGLPKEILSLTNLEKLDVRYCPLRELPNLSSLKNLKYLIANNAQIKTIENIGLESLSNLKEININSNPNITSIEPLINCVNLEIISCSGAKLTAIPAGIENLTQLKELILSDNRELSSLPANFVNLKSLKSLDISRTNIEVLPENFSKLPLEKMRIIDTNCKTTSDYKILKKRLKNKFRD